MLFHISQPSFMSLYVEMLARGQKIGSGTAFVASSSAGTNFLVTNRHIVTGRHQETGKTLDKNCAYPDTLRVWHNSKQELGYFVPVDVPLLSNDVPRWIEHPTLKDKADFVALPMSASDNIAVYPYQVGHLSRRPLEPTQRVSVVGFPFGERTAASFAIWSTGFIASEPEMNHGERPVFLIDCRSREGQSGSPVIRYRSHDCVTQNGSDLGENFLPYDFLGIYSGRINKDSDLGFVWKSHAVAELLTYAITQA